MCIGRIPDLREERLKRDQSIVLLDGRSPKISALVLGMIERVSKPHSQLQFKDATRKAAARMAWKPDRVG